MMIMKKEVCQAFIYLFFFIFVCARVGMIIYQKTKIDKVEEVLSFGVLEEK